MIDPIVSIVEDVANRLLRQDPETLDRLAELDGRIICVALRGASLKFYIRPFGGGLRLSDSCDAEPDVVLTASAPAFVRLLLERGDSGVLFDGAVRLAGDSRLAQRFQRILARLDIDREELLARILGDVAAHQLGRTLRGGGHWLRVAAATLGRDAVEYLQEEQPELARPQAVDDYTGAVDALRADVDRLEQRVRLLQERFAP